MANTLQFKVEGMTCGGCARSVRQALESVPGVTAAQVTVGEPVKVQLAGDVGADALAAAVERAGFRATFDA